MNTYRKPFGWRFLFVWTFAIYFGILASRFISLLVLVFFKSHPLLFDDPRAHMLEVSLGLIVLVSAVSFGGLVGIAQWVMLRRFVALRGIVWVGVTILGYLIAMLIVITPTLGGDIWSGGILGIIITGGTLGIFQWFALRKRVNRAWLWIGISLIGWAVAGGIVGILGKLVAATFVWILFSNPEFFGTILSSLGLWWFLKYSPLLAELRTDGESVAKSEHPLT